MYSNMNDSVFNMDDMVYLTRYPVTRLRCRVTNLWSRIACVILGYEAKICRRNQTAFQYYQN